MGYARVHVQKIFVYIRATFARILAIYQNKKLILRIIFVTNAGILYNFR